MTGGTVSEYLFKKSPELNLWMKVLQSVQELKNTYFKSMIPPLFFALTFAKIYVISRLGSADLFK